jgi:hypothetical protein
VATSGSTITIISSTQVLRGTYDPGSGSFSVTSDNQSLTFGTSQTVTMKKTLSATSISGTYVNTVTPPTASCTTTFSGTAPPGS